MMAPDGTGNGGVSHTLGTHVNVGGEFGPRELPHPPRSATTDDDYEVRLAEAGVDVHPESEATTRRPRAHRRIQQGDRS